MIYHSGGQNTRNNGQPHRTGGCFSCLGRKVRIHKVTVAVTNDTCETLFIKHSQNYTLKIVHYFWHWHQKNSMPSRDDIRSLSTEQRWIPPSTVRRDALTPESRNDLIFRKVRGILNKLTPEKFAKLSNDLLNVELNSHVILKGVIFLVCMMWTS